MGILFLFLDGVGIGSRDPGVNPFFHVKLPAFRKAMGGSPPSLRDRFRESSAGRLIPLDATLGVPGLPQSGTGQTALFTGENGPKLAGKHFGPYPYSSLKPVLERSNIFHRLLLRKHSVAFANAFPQRFFDYVERHPSRLTVTTLSCLYAGVPLRRFHDLQRGEAVSADITGEGWHTLGYPTLATIDPVEAGRRLVRLTREYTLVLFEYWKTDHAGHSQSMSEAVDVLERFDSLLEGVLTYADMRNTLVVLTSDHGNVEDLSTRTHTRHPVPLLAWGHRHKEFLRDVEGRGRRSGPDLTAVVPALLSLLGTHGAESVMP